VSQGLVPSLASAIRPSQAEPWSDLIAKEKLDEGSLPRRCLLQTSYNLHWATLNCADDSSEEDQAAFLRLVFDSAEQLSMPLVVWFGPGPNVYGRAALRPASAHRACAPGRYNEGGVAGVAGGGPPAAGRGERPRALERSPPNTSTSLHSVHGAFWQGSRPSLG